MRYFRILRAVLRACRSLPILVVLPLLLVFAGCREAAPVIATRFQAFGTQVDLNLVGVSQASAQGYTAAIRSDLELMQREWDPWTAGPMERVNRRLAEGGPFVAPPSILPLIRLGQGIYDRSGGLYNPTLGRLTELWGLNAPIPECHPPPRETSIRRILAADPKPTDIRIDGLELQCSNPAVKLDFGDLARAYAVDLTMGYLREQGVRDAEVQIGGVLRAIGDRSSQPWRVPIRRASGAGVLAVLPVKGDEAVGSLYASDRTFIYGGTTYHSILDPRTGSPAWDTLAVTVAHEDAATAQGAAAAIFVAGPERWTEVARALGIRYVLLVDSRGTVHLSPEMRRRIELVEEGANLDVGPSLAEPAAQASKSPSEEGH
jgi:thiamine biosynthesis lipoprotein